MKHYIYHQKPTTTKKRFGAKSANSIWREKKEKKRVTVREREKTHETNHANEFFFSLSGRESQNSISLPLYPFVFFFFCSRFSLSHSILGLLRIGFFFFYRKCNVFKLLLCVSEFFFFFFNCESKWKRQRCHVIIDGCKTRELHPVLTECILLQLNLYDSIFDWCQINTTVNN